MSKQMYILAGANGSGKSTISKVLLAEDELVFVNPDDIAKEISPLDMAARKIDAGREALRRIDDLLARGCSFAVESTLSGRAYVHMLEKAKSLGYETVIVYVFVDSPEVCIARIAARVKTGGHNVPDEDVRRRYARSKVNFITVYGPMVDQWLLYYNGEEKSVLVAQKGANGEVGIFDRRGYFAFTEGTCQNLQ